MKDENNVDSATNYVSTLLILYQLDQLVTKLNNVNAAE